LSISTRNNRQRNIKRYIRYVFLGGIQSFYIGCKIAGATERTNGLWTSEISADYDSVLVQKEGACCD